VFTVDTSVWVNASDTLEAGWEVSRALLQELAKRQSRLILPSLVLPEIAGAIARTRANPLLGEQVAYSVLSLPTVRIIGFGRSLALRALDLAAKHRLRGADAVYAAVALAHHTTLISLDGEHLSRLVGIVSVLSPAQALADLDAESTDS
jgi:predicted nucleic acid-binding protein